MCHASIATWKKKKPQNNIHTIRLPRIARFWWVLSKFTAAPQLRIEFESLMPHLWRRPAVSTTLPVQKTPNSCHVPGTAVSAHKENSQCDCSLPLSKSGYTCFHSDTKGKHENTTYSFTLLTKGICQECYCGLLTGCHQNAALFSMQISMEKKKKKHYLDLRWN